MKGIVLASDKDASGKRIITMGLMKALINREYQIQGYKVGPDFISPGFHTFISGRASRNLAVDLMGEDGVRASFSRGKGDIAIVEGKAGFYDGVGIGTEGSTAHVSNLIQLPVVLVLSPKTEIATLFAQINGIISYEKNNIVGVILNQVSHSYYESLKEGIEKYCHLKVFGYLPSDPRLDMGSEGLGLMEKAEMGELIRKVDYLSDLMEKHVDIPALLEVMGKVQEYPDPFKLERKDIKIGIALDRAFNFYFKENIELLEQIGQVAYFSPLEDKKLPEDLDVLYIGGGYPEVFIKQLSENKSLLKDIKNQLNNGLRCHAESGGLLYLMEGTKENPLVAFFEGLHYTAAIAQQPVSKENTTGEYNPTHFFGDMEKLNDYLTV